MEQLLPRHIHRGKINDLTEYSNDPQNNNIVGFMGLINVIMIKLFMP